jgi:hypothetical protein
VITETDTDPQIQMVEDMGRLAALQMKERLKTKIGRQDRADYRHCCDKQIQEITDMVITDTDTDTDKADYRHVIEEQIQTQHCYRQQTQDTVITARHSTCITDKRHALQTRYAKDSQEM